MSQSLILAGVQILLIFVCFTNGGLLNDNPMKCYKCHSEWGDDYCGAYLPFNVLEVPLINCPIADMTKTRSYCWRVIYEAAVGTRPGHRHRADRDCVIMNGTGGGAGGCTTGTDERGTRYKECLCSVTGCNDAPQSVRTDLRVSLLTTLSVLWLSKGFF